jgi:hypothetical protein
MKLIKLGDVDPLAVCLDGSPGSLYINSATLGNSSNWLIFFQGGGWCYSESDCLERSLGSLGSSKGLIDNANPGMSGLSSLNCTSNPDFCGWNIVNLNYCDGDSFSGNRGDAITVGGKQIFSRGHRILAASIQLLATSFGLKNAESVLLSGCSAGGVSAFLHSDYVHEKLISLAPGLKKFKVVPLSGIFPVTIDNVAGESVYADQMKYAYSMHNASSGVHQGCLSAAKQGEEWLCNTAQGAYPHVCSPIFFVNSAYDSW